MGTPGTPTLPAQGSLTPAPTVSSGTQKTNLENWLASVWQLVGSAPVQTLTISGGNLTPTLAQALGQIKVDTEAAAASDDLDHLVQTSVYTQEGRWVVLSAFNDSRTVVVRHNIAGNGLFLLAKGVNFSLDTDDKFLIVRREGTTWVEVFRSYGRDVTAQRGFLELGSSAIVNASATPAASIIPIANGSGVLADGWISKSSVDQHAGLVAVAGLLLSGTPNLDVLSSVIGLAAFEQFELDLLSFFPASNAKQLALQVSTDNGSTWKAGASDYKYAGKGIRSDGAADIAIVAQADTQLRITAPSQQLASAQLASVCIKLRAKGTGGVFPVMFGYDGGYESDGSVYVEVRGGGKYTGAGPINAVRLKMADGSNWTALGIVYARQ